MKNKTTNNQNLDENSVDNFTDTNQKCIVNWEIHHAINKTPISTFSITDMILTFNDFKKQLTKKQLTSILTHFNEIYECTQLEEREFKMCYLAYLWKNKQVVLTEIGYDILNAKALGIDVDADFVISFESEDAVGFVNLGILHDYYIFQTLEGLV